MPEITKTEKVRKQWSSEPAFIFSMSAAAVGLGNLWRFPYITGQNGGGAFVVAYLIAIFVIVFPLMLFEVAAGRLAQGSAVRTFRKAGKLGGYFGWFVILVTTAITSYYLVITGWTLGYAVDSIRGDLRVFSDFTQGYNSLWYFLAVTIIAMLVLLRGVSAIEKLSKMMMPVLFVIIIGLIYIASGTDGWSQTKEFFLQADYSRLKESKVWAFAFGQAFYSLAIGQGYLVTYGSYIPKKTNLPRACLIVTVTEVSVALLAGWMIFPFVFSLGMDPAGGSQLAFSTLPRIFENMAGGRWIGIAFFCLFFVAAFSSAIAGLKVIAAAIEEELLIHENKAVLIVVAIMLVLGVFSALSFTPLELSINNEPVLDFIDRLVGTNVIIFSGLFGALFYTWFVPPIKIRHALGTNTRWFEWRIYLIGRFFPIIILIWIVFRALF